jgi:hypothetical protein
MNTDTGIDIDMHVHMTYPRYLRCIIYICMRYRIHLHPSKPNAPTKEKERKREREREREGEGEKKTEIRRGIHQESEADMSGSRRCCKHRVGPGFVGGGGG